MENNYIQSSNNTYNRSPAEISEQDRQSGDIPTERGNGKLIFRVTTARGAIPLMNAQITVNYHLPEPDTNRANTIAVLYTDRDGKTEPLVLEAPKRALSMFPSSNGANPFSYYDAEILLDGYQRQSYSRIPIFDGITSIQPADLIPLLENGKTDFITPDDDRFVEGMNPDL